MKRRVLFLALAIITAGIVSFTKVTGSYGKQAATTQTLAITSDVSVESNSNGSTRRITWHESNTAVYEKSFAYHNGAAIVTEKLNGKLIKVETAEFNDGLLSTIKGKLFSTDGNVASLYTMAYQYNDAGQTLRVLYGNGDRHDYVYDARKNLVETNWYNRQGEMMATAKKQYFPRLPDAFTVYRHTADNNYAPFMPATGGKTPLCHKMSDKTKAKISFDGRHTYVLDTDGYLLSY